MTFLSFTSTRLGLWSVLSKDTPRKNPENPVQLKPETPGTWVEQPRRTPRNLDISKLKPLFYPYFICHLQVILTLYQTVPTINDPEEDAFWKHCGKKHFLLFRKKKVSTLPKQNFGFSFTFILLSANYFEFGLVLSFCHLVQIKYIPWE